MPLDDPARDRLARALAAALPTWEDRAAVASAADLSDVQLAGTARIAWGVLVDEAHARDALPRLVRAAARRRPDHAGLARLAAGIDEGRVDAGPPWRPAVIGAAVVAALVAGAAVLTGGDDPEGGEPVEVGAVEAAPANAPAAQQGPREVPPPPAPSAAAPTPAAAPPPAPPPAPSGSADAAPPPARPAERPSPAASTTPGPDAPCVGWAYMGETTSLRAGEVWEVPQAVNVRRSHPSAENGWTLGERVCVLPAGARIPLADDPVFVPGGAYWVRVDGP